MATNIIEKIKYPGMYVLKLRMRGGALVAIETTTIKEQAKEYSDSEIGDILKILNNNRITWQKQIIQKQ